MKTDKLLYFILFVVIASLNIFLIEIDAKNIRSSAVAGKFYPIEKERLIKMIDSYLSKADTPEVQGKLLGIISPHAGYLYSGQVAAYSYKLLKNTKYDVVIIMGDSHNMAYNFGSVYYNKDNDNYFQTPIGDVRINKALSEELLKNENAFTINTKAHAFEHSIEAQLPFLQQVLEPGFEIVPILFGTRSSRILESAANSIYNAIKDKNVLLIASTDLSHYYDYKTAQKMDSAGIEAIKTLDQFVLIDKIIKNETQFCGLAGVLVEMIVANKMGANNIQVLNMANSGDVLIGDKNKVVGYAAIAITKK